MLLNLQVGRSHIREKFGELFDDSRCILIVAKLLEHLCTSRQFQVDTNRGLRHKHASEGLTLHSDSGAAFDPSKPCSSINRVATD